MNMGLCMSVPVCPRVILVRVHLAFHICLICTWCNVSKTITVIIITIIIIINHHSIIIQLLLISLFQSNGCYSIIIINHDKPPPRLGFQGTLAKPMRTKDRAESRFLADRFGHGLIIRHITAWVYVCVYICVCVRVCVCKYKYLYVHRY